MLNKASYAPQMILAGTVAGCLIAGAGIDRALYHPYFVTFLVLRLVLAVFFVLIIRMAGGGRLSGNGIVPPLSGALICFTFGIMANLTGDGYRSILACWPVVTMAGFVALNATPRRYAIVLLGCWAGYLLAIHGVLPAGATRHDGVIVNLLFAMATALLMVLHHLITPPGEKSTALTGREQDIHSQNQYLITVFAQDIKNRMHALKIFLRAMEKDYPNDESLLYALQSQKRIQNSVGNLIHVFSENEIVLKPRSVSVVRLADDFSHGWAILFRNKNIPWTIEKKTHCALFIDYELMGLVWENLLSNAYQFTPRGGTVLVRFDCVAAKAAISFLNSGDTIAEPLRQRLFEKNLSAGKHASGVKGLGLYYSRMMCRKHGGELIYAVDGQGRNEFIVSLPLHDDEKGPTST
jgi:signal transduction histidine kinase